MVCSISCSISTIFIIGMIFFYNATNKNGVTERYRATLNLEQREIYNKISKERLNISIQGYVLGFVLSLLIIFYYYNTKGIRSSNMVCMVIATSFLTNYFYYKLAPKTDWMLNHIESQKQSKEWVEMYRSMQFYYHGGLVLGIIGVAVFAYAFRC